MPSFRTDLVALATIAGSAMIGGLGTFAVLERSHAIGHSSIHDMAVFRDIDHRIEVRTSDGQEAFFIQGRLRADSDRIEGRRRRHRHRHPHRAERTRFERNGMVRIDGAWANWEAQGEQVFQRHLRQELDEVRAKLAADQGRFERDQRR